MRRESILESCSQFRLRQGKCANIFDFCIQRIEKLKKTQREEILTIGVTASPQCVRLISTKLIMQRNNSSEEYKWTKHECFIRYPNTEKWLRKRGAAEFFLTNFKVFGYRMKHPFECLIQLLKPLIILGENQSKSSPDFIIRSHFQTSFTAEISFVFSA